jgi:exopolysaccharide biosynthesis polyprenyl glycosylphosphotransferase
MRSHRSSCWSPASSGETSHRQWRDSRDSDRRFTTASGDREEIRALALISDGRIRSRSRADAESGDDLASAVESSVPADVAQNGQSVGPPGAKGWGSTLRAYLDLDRAEARRRAAIGVRQRIYRRSLAVADLCAVSAVLFIGATVLGDDSLTIWVIGAVALLVLVMKVVGLYDRDELLLHKTTLDELPSLFEVATVGTLLLWLVGDQIVSGDLGRRQIFGMWALLFLLLIIMRSLARYLATRLTQPERCLLIGDSQAAEALQRKLAIGGAVSAKIVTRIPVTWGKVDSDGVAVPILHEKVERILTEQQIHRVILAPGRVESVSLLHFVSELRALEVSVSVLPATPPLTRSAYPDYIHGITLFGVPGFEIGRSSRLLKRVFDVVASSLALLVLSPLLLATAVAIRVDSPGPVLFRQRRIGRDGRPFEIFKFRSMYTGSETGRDELRELNEADGLFKIERDPRITRVGRAIRSSSLDELPQLINVLRGEMSLVGPRPLVPDEDAKIDGFYRRRLEITPGITGSWQSLGASRIPLREMIQLDFLYVASWSLWNDMRILLRTVSYVVGRRGR